MTDEEMTPEETERWLQGQYQNRVRHVAEFGVTITPAEAGAMSDETWFAFADAAKKRWEHAATTPAIALIAAERRRQIIVHGYDVTNPADAEFYRDDQLCDAAVQYIAEGLTSCWPENWTHPYKGGEDRIRDLVKAGALIAAEIDRQLSLQQ